MTRLWTDYLKEIENRGKVTFKNGTDIKVEKDTIPKWTTRNPSLAPLESLFSQWYEDYINGMLSESDDCLFGVRINKTKEKKDMLTITNYKYDEKTGRTTIWWSDGTLTKVTADPDTEPNEFVGFVSAAAKKLFGNKSTYLNQFDKWTVKIPARKKAEAEKKAAEDKAREEARAKRAAKRAERKAKRDIEIRAKQLADEYYAQEIEDEAEKIAHEKYGVPKNWFDGYSED